MKKFGFSGDLVEIKNNQVFKTCYTDQDRFLRNVKKQKEFRNSYLQAVPILEQGVIAEKNYICMPLLQCENPLQWLSKTSVENIEIVSNLLSSYLLSIIDGSIVVEFDYPIWKSKVLSVQNKITDIELKETCSQLLKIDYSIPLYRGYSHGDLTLSNVFISQDDNVAIDVIDFLDSFLESPIHDFTKIRQDTKHLWTLRLSDDIDKNKVVLVLHHIDKYIERIISNDPILNHYYSSFQILNLLRIVPYNTDPIIFSYLKQEIRELSKCLPH